jgi:hypothetical protein
MKRVILLCAGLFLLGGCVTRAHLKRDVDLARAQAAVACQDELAKVSKNHQANLDALADKTRDAYQGLSEAAQDVAALESINRYLAVNCKCIHKDVLTGSGLPGERIQKFLANKRCRCRHKDLLQGF